LLHQTLKQSSSLTADLHAFLQAVVAESTGLIVSRQVLSETVAALATLTDADIQKQVLQNAVAVLQPRAVTFEEQITALRMLLADLLEKDEDWAGCAQTLMAIPLDSGHRTVTDEFKLGVYVRIVRLLLEEDDAVTAESYFNRATLLIHSTTDKATQRLFFARPFLLVLTCTRQSATNSRNAASSTPNAASTRQAPSTTSSRT
jgi:COP9 signalosome complex subunit 4